MDYLERVPDGYVSKKGELISKIKQMQGTMSQMQGVAKGGQITPTEPAIPLGKGNAELQRSLNKTGVTRN